MKRFWTDAVVVRADDGFTVLLDGKPMRLPGGLPLSLDERRLADAIAEEWREAGRATGEMDLSEVPLTRLAGTARHRIAPDPDPTIAAITAYGASDLICYRAETPDALRAKEDAAWQPWLEWADAVFDARLRVATGIGFVAQDPLALSRLRAAVGRHNAFALAGLGILVPALGSLVLGLAVAEGRLTAAQAHGLSIVDDLYQEQLWGADDLAVARRAAITRDIADAARLIQLSTARVPR